MSKVVSAGPLHGAASANGWSTRRTSLAGPESDDGADDDDEDVAADAVLDDGNRLADARPGTSKSSKLCARDEVAKAKAGGW